MSTNFDDSLLGSELAATEHGPLLLTSTASLATAAIVDKTINPHPTDVLVADGTWFEDPLSASAAAGGVIGAPLLWTPTTTLDSNDAEFLGMEHASGRLEQVLILGGTDTVSNGVEGSLRSALS